MSELLSDYVHTNEAVTVMVFTDLITEGAIVELEQTHNSMDSNFTESADWDFETDKDLEKIEPYINGYRKLHGLLDVSMPEFNFSAEGKNGFGEKWTSK